MKRPLLLPLPLLALALVFAPGSATACPDVRPAPERPNGIELGLGATNVDAAVGMGGLTAAVSRCGEITTLKWPGPSFYDQLSYVTSNAEDARSRPHLGAFPSMGAFAGVAWKTADGGRGFAWLRDWERSQRYADSRSDVVRTEYVEPALGLRVVQWTFVLAGRDVLSLQFEAERLPGSPLTKAWVVLYENFAPAESRIPFFPIADTGLDHQNDFAVVWDAEHEALLHFRPSRPDYALVNPVLQSPPADPEALQDAVQQVVTDLGDEPGIYLAVGARDRTHAFQAGFDDADLCPYQAGLVERAVAGLGVPADLAPFVETLFACDPVALPDGPLGACRVENGWTWQAESAYRDAADGRLSGSPIAACQANGAVMRELPLGGRSPAVAFYVAAGRTRDEARAGLAAARDPATPPEVQRAATQKWWGEFLASARLPDTADEKMLRFARRALVSLRTATDAASGAMVASVAGQPPYGLDWPRDGAFLNHALDLAGYPDLVTRHNLFYVRVQRRGFQPWSPLFPFRCPADPARRVYPRCVPPGTFEMNYYATTEGAEPGGPISFEIDTTGLALWTLWDHAAFLPDPEERAAYLESVCPAIALGTESLASCRDPETGLQCPANEDDNFEITQGLQGAETVLLALKSGIEAAGDCGFDAATVSAWEARAAELDAAILENFLVETPTPHFEGARRAWMIWPVRFRAPDDPLMASHGAFVRERSVRPVLERTAPAGGYNGENLLAEAKRLAALGDAAGLAVIAEEVRGLVDRLATPDTLHLAEFAGRVDADLDGDGVAPDYLPENDVPHVWQQSFLYMAALVAHGAGEPAPRPCDVDDDGRIDLRDKELLGRAFGRPSEGLLDPRDPDEDGWITPADAAACWLRCDAPDCAPPRGCALPGAGGGVLACVMGVRWRRRRR